MTKQAAILTCEERILVRKDFEDWSGGHPPHECDDDEIRTYLRGSAPADLSRKAIKAFLAEWAEEGRAEDARTAKLDAVASSLEESQAKKVVRELLLLWGDRHLFSDGELAESMGEAFREHGLDLSGLDG